MLIFCITGFHQAVNLPLMRFEWDVTPTQVVHVLCTVRCMLLLTQLWHTWNVAEEGQEDVDEHILRKQQASVRTEPSKYLPRACDCPPPLPRGRKRKAHLIAKTLLQEDTCGKAWPFQSTGKMRLPAKF